jgi:uncharacterized protein (TIGR03435 family)
MMREALLACLLTVGVASGQAPAKAPKFEVASVRAVPPGKEGMTDTVSYEGGSFVVKNATLEFMINIAYEVPPWNILGKPDWLAVRQYDVSARPEGETGMTYETMRPMLQQLLQQRFHLAVHRETQKRAGYALVVAKGGVRLKAGKEGGKQNYIMANGIRGGGVSLSVLATMLAIPLGKPVMDRSETKGIYEVDLHFAPENSPDSTLPSLFTALEEQAGLKLEPQKVPVGMLVIDHAESEPTEN